MKKYYLDQDNKNTFTLINQNGVSQLILSEPTLHPAIWDAISDKDGNVYFSECSELTTSEIAKLSKYYPEEKRYETLFELKNYIFPHEKMIRDSKIHTSMAWMNDGRLVMVTHTTDKSPIHPAWMPLPYYGNPWEGYAGSSMLIYDPVSNKLENLGIPVPRETLYGGAYDPLNNTYYSLGFIRGHLYGIDLNDRSVKDYGQAVERASYRMINGTDGNIYFSTRNGLLQRFNVRNKIIENLHIQLPYKDIPTRARPYISYAVNGPDGKMYIAGMFDERLCCLDPANDSFELIGNYLPIERYSKNVDDKPYLACMGFDKNRVLYYIVCCINGDGKDYYKMPAMLFKWDFFNNEKPIKLGIVGTQERATVTTCSMIMDNERDLIHIFSGNHAKDAPDIITINLSEFRKTELIEGPVTKDQFCYKDNLVYDQFGSEQAEWKKVIADNPNSFTYGRPVVVNLWEEFDDSDVYNSSVRSIKIGKEGVTVVCGVDSFTEFRISFAGKIIDSEKTDGYKGKTVPALPKSELPYYPGRKYLSEADKAIEMNDGKILVATKDGLLALVKDESVFNLGPAVVNGTVNDMAFAKNNGTVYGVAGNEDDFGIVFSFDEAHGVRWRGNVTFTNPLFGDCSSPELSAIDVNDEDTVIAIGAGGRMGTVYLFIRKA